MSRCIGCGIKIQSNDPLKAGYVPEIKLIEQGEDVYCKRCYEIMHHNATYDYSTSTTSYYQKISSIKDTKSLIILIVDVLNLNSSFIPNLKDYATTVSDLSVRAFCTQSLKPSKTEEYLHT